MNAGVYLDQPSLEETNEVHLVSHHSFWDHTGYVLLVHSRTPTLWIFDGADMHFSWPEHTPEPELEAERWYYLAGVYDHPPAHGAGIPHRGCLIEPPARGP